MLFIGSSSMQICSSTVAADILPLARLLEGMLRFYISDERLRHILSTCIGPSCFYKFPIPFHARVFMLIMTIKLRNTGCRWKYMECNTFWSPHNQLTINSKDEKSLLSDPNLSPSSQVEIPEKAFFPISELIVSWLSAVTKSV